MELKFCEKTYEPSERGRTKQWHASKSSGERHHSSEMQKRLHLHILNVIDCLTAFYVVNCVIKSFTKDSQKIHKCGKSLRCLMPVKLCEAL